MLQRKLRVGVLFGGQSGEHEVSLASARSVLAALNPERYEAVPIGIAKDGRWLASGNPLVMLERTAITGHLPASAQPIPSTEVVAVARDATSRSPLAALDVVFPVLHGPLGEDGTVQGMLELADIPYVGSGVAASAVGMDKVLMKQLFVSYGLPVVDYTMVLRRDWEARPDRVERQIEERIGYPCFVKPSNLGSSVGVTKARDRQELQQGLADAAQYDRKIIIEKAVANAREIECSVLGNDEPMASIPGEVVPSREFYDYAAKYLDNASELRIPAPIPTELAEQVRDLAVRAFKALDCAGMARVDFLLDGVRGDLYLNELNTIPGFTRISMYAKLWEASGIPYAGLLDRLIALALERYQEKRRSARHYLGKALQPDEAGL